MLLRQPFLCWLQLCSFLCVLYEVGSLSYSDLPGVPSAFLLLLSPHIHSAWNVLAVPRHSPCLGLVCPEKFTLSRNCFFPLSLHQFGNTFSWHFSFWVNCLCELVISPSCFILAETQYIFWINVWIHSNFQASCLLTLNFFPPTKVTLPSNKNLKLLSEAKTQKGLFSDEEDTEVRNYFFSSGN